MLAGVTLRQPVLAPVLPLWAGGRGAAVGVLGNPNFVPSTAALHLQAGHFSLGLSVPIVLNERIKRGRLQGSLSLLKRSRLPGQTPSRIPSVQGLGSSASCGTGSGGGLGVTRGPRLPV